MEELGVISLYEKVTDAFASLPLIGKKVELDIYEHVTQDANKGLWSVLAEWEGKVRNSAEMQSTNKAMEEAFGARKKK